MGFSPETLRQAGEILPFALGVLPIALIKMWSVKGITFTSCEGRRNGLYRGEIAYPRFHSNTAIEIFDGGDALVTLSTGAHLLVEDFSPKPGDPGHGKVTVIGSNRKPLMVEHVIQELWDDRDDQRHGTGVYFQYSDQWS